MSAIATAIVTTAFLGNRASSKAAGVQAAASDRASELQNKQYLQTREDQMPFLEAGKGALNQLIPLASNYKPFSMNEFEKDPGYSFRFSEGLKALDRSAASRGGLISGGALKAATRFGQDLSSQEYTNAFNRYQTERNAQLNPLQSLAGVGQTTATNLSNAGQTAATNIGNNYMGAANARASGYMGGATALTSGLGTYINYNQSNALLGALRNNGANSQFNPASNNFVGPLPQYQAPVEVPAVNYGNNYY